jgi:hypothetical protein
MNKRYLLFREAFKTATYLDSLFVTIVGTKKATRHAHVYGKNPKWMKFLRTWGGRSGNGESQNKDYS